MGKKVLITGAGGFIGSSLARSFLESGHDINLFIRPSSNLWRIEKIKKELKIHVVDLLDDLAIKEAVRNINPEIILHCACYGGHMNSETDRQLMLKTNLASTIILLEACLITGFESFVNTGSSSEYGEFAGPIPENKLLEPANFYGATKAAASTACSHLGSKNDMPITTLRLFSPYGYFDSKDRLIPKLIIDFIAGRERIDLYSASAVRDYVFIEDVVEAYRQVVLMSGKLNGRVFNIGSGIQRSVEDVVGELSKNFEKSPDVTYGNGLFKQKEPKSWVADISSAKEFLGWSPKYDFSSGIAETVAWFRSNGGNYD